jgi:Domain of unknown function (DUF4399)
MIRRVRLAFALAFALAPAAVVVAPSFAADEHEHAAASSGAIQRTPRPADAKLYIISPKNGETVKSPVTVRFGLTGMGVAPAGVASASTGHHHLIIDAPLPPMDQPLPKDERHLHFGGGQTEATVDLPPGEHTLQLILADKDHVPFDPPLYSQPIKIHVKK